MNRNILILIIGIIVVVVIAAVYYVGLNPSVSNKNYSNEYFAFNYPSTWSLQGTVDISDDMKVRLDKNTTQITNLEIFHLYPNSTESVTTTVTRMATSPAFVVYVGNYSGSLDDYKNMLTSQLGKENVANLNEKPITINGQSAYEIIFQNSAGTQQQKTIIFIKNGQLYTLIFTAKDLKEIEKDMNTIINSFQVK